MTAKSTNGWARARGIREQLRGDAAAIISETGIKPTLAVVLVGADPVGPMTVSVLLANTLIAARRQLGSSPR